MQPQNSTLPVQNGGALFFRLIRWPNLVFIVLTQAAFQYCILNHGNPDGHTGLNASVFCLVTLSYALIAAAGYIINDYFDLEIDLMNKPQKVFIGQEISRQRALGAYILMNACAMIATAYADFMSGTITGSLSLVCCIGLLYWYSAALKKSFLFGNLVVAGVTAWSIPVLTCLYYANGDIPSWSLWITIIYTSFAFVISLVREMVKDLEDVRGDEAHGCRTIPIVWGTEKARLFTLFWLALLAAMVSASACYLAIRQNWLGAGYTLLCIATPLFVILRGLMGASQSSDYHKLSTRIKVVMALGILSMVLFVFY